MKIGKNDAPLATTSAAGFMSAADKIRLANMDDNATANQSDAYLLNRGNHTGTQSIDTIDGLQQALDNKLDSSQFIRAIRGGWSGKPAVGEVVGDFAPYTMTLSATNSTAKSLTAATASAVFTIRKGTTNIGTITFGVGATTGTISISSPNVTYDDIINVVPPATQDATLANVFFKLTD